MSTPSTDFLKLIGYLGLPLTAQNLAFFTDLFVNFTQFYTEQEDSLEMKFIKWKRFYDAISFPLQIPATHEILETTAHTDLDYVDAINTNIDIEQPLLSNVSPQDHQPCQIASTSSSPQTTTPPPTSPQLVPTNVQLPHELIPIQQSQNCYQNFILKNDADKQTNMTEHIEIMATSLQAEAEAVPCSQGKKHCPNERDL
jgi:hypothetical protein